MVKVVKKIGQVISYAFMALAIYVVASTVFCVFRGQLPSVFGCNYFIVETGSMEPTIQVDDFIVSKKSTIDKVEKNDIITFYCVDDSLSVVGQVITHRVIEVEEIDGVIYLTTKGDNEKTNPVADNKKVTEDNFIGIVVGHSSIVGNVITFVTTNNGFYILIAVVGIMLCIMGISIKEIKVEKIKSAEAKRKEDLKNELLLEILREQQNEKEVKDNEGK